MSFEHPLWHGNKVIARIFKELGFIEQWGSGINRIRTLCQQAGNPDPAIRESGDFVDIEFHRANKAEMETPGGEIGGEIRESGGEIPVQSDLTERQSAVLALINQDPHITQRQLATALGINGSAVQKHLDKLKAAGAIERVGGTRGYWKITP